jgi:hypothetical protein
MRLCDAIIDMTPAPCGLVAIAAVLGVKVTRVICALFVNDAPIWATSAYHLDMALARFGRSLTFIEEFCDPCPPRGLLDERAPIIRALPLVVLAVDERREWHHWLAIKGERTADAEMT